MSSSKPQSTQGQTQPVGTHEKTDTPPGTGAQVTGAVERSEQSSDVDVVRELRLAKEALEFAALEKEELAKKNADFEKKNADLAKAKGASLDPEPAKAKLQAAQRKSNQLEGELRQANRKIAALADENRELQGQVSALKVTTSSEATLPPVGNLPSRCARILESTMLIDASNTRAHVLRGDVLVGIDGVKDWEKVVADVQREVAGRASVYGITEETAKYFHERGLLTSA